MRRSKSAGSWEAGSLEVGGTWCFCLLLDLRVNMHVLKSFLGDETYMVSEWN